MIYRVHLAEVQCSLCLSKLRQQIADVDLRGWITDHEIARLAAIIPHLDRLVQSLLEDPRYRRDVVGVLLDVKTAVSRMLTSTIAWK